jgi:hypothetical protein
MPETSTNDSCTSQDGLEFGAFIQQIDFRLCQPDSKATIFKTLASAASRFRVSLETANTRLPCDAAEMKRRLDRLARIPKMSTYAIGAMINYGVARMLDGDSFVNVGVWNGFSFLSGLVGNRRKKCIGVDNFSEFGGPRDHFLRRFEQHRSASHMFYDMDYLAYFDRVHQESIGFYLYDGGHSYDHQLKGLQVAEPYFSDRCIILVDDTNLEAPRQATLDFVRQSDNDYELLLDKTTSANRHPTLWNGVMVLQKAA